MIPNEEFCHGIHKHQQALFAEFDRRRFAGMEAPQIFMCEWHRRCRKTTLALNLNIREACRFPKGKYGHICPTQVMARNIIWDDPNMLRKYLPDKREMGWRLNEQKMLIIFENESILKIGGADEPDSWRGTDFVGVTLDEWALMKEIMWSEILRPVIGGPLPDYIRKYQPFRWANFLYTPKGSNHASRMFDDCCCVADGGSIPSCGVAKRLKDNTYASRVIGEKSGIYTAEELDRMRAEMPAAIYDQEVNCSRVTSEEMTLITTAMIHALNEYHAGNAVLSPVCHKIVSIDPAFGGDVCRIMGIEDGFIKGGERIRDKHLTNEIVAAGKLVAKRMDTKNFIVDCIGVGLGVADGLACDEAKYNVQYFNSAEKAEPDLLSPIQFANLRAQAYSYYAEQIRHYNTGPIDDPELMRQLSVSSQYTVNSSGKLLIAPKKKIKEILGHSPDDADCRVMGEWGLQYARVENKNSDRIGYKDKTKRPKSPMVMA
jgi:hypothetical protein